MLRVITAYLQVIVTFIICTVVSFLLQPYVASNNLILIYLIGVAFIAVRFSHQQGLTLIAVILSALTYDFFFTPPYFSLSITNSSDIITIIMMFVVAQIISQLTIRSKKHYEAAEIAKAQIEKERFQNLLLLSISHDLRTPLTSIMGSASSLLYHQQQLTIPMQAELAKNIYVESERLNLLINNVLQIIRIEAGHTGIKKEMHLLEEVIGNALHKIERLLGDRTLNIEFKPTAHLISLDTTLIEQVIVNLLENAVKFSPEKSCIKINSEINEHHALIKITDEGKGIAAQDLDKIFDKFYRSGKAETNGIGLGLTFCREIIHIHGGKIWAENALSGGASFCFTLPFEVNHV